MWNDLLKFLYITNREITVLSLCAMFPLDVILFYLMSRYGFKYRLAFGVSLIATFAWALSWFVEPPRPASFEPIMREGFLVVLMVIKSIRIVQALQTTRHGNIHGLQVKPMTRRERTVSLLAGAGALSISTAVAIGFWLFTAYRNNEDKEALKVEAVQTNTQILKEVQHLVAHFETKLDSALRISVENGQNIKTIKKQGKTGIDLATLAARKADRIATKLKEAEAAQKRGKTIPAKPITGPGSPNWYDNLLKRFNKNVGVQRADTIPKPVHAFAVDM